MPIGANIRDVSQQLFSRVRLAVGGVDHLVAQADGEDQGVLAALPAGGINRISAPVIKVRVGHFVSRRTRYQVCHVPGVVVRVVIRRVIGIGRIKFTAG